MFGAPPFCKYCGKPLVGRYVQVQGSSYHMDCYRNFVAPRCVYCNEPLTEAYMADQWGAKFCAKHRQEYPACDFCGRLIPPAQQERSKEKLDSVRCLLCRTRAIDTSDEARPAFAQVKRWVGTLGMKYNNFPLTLRLCDRDFLGQFSRAHSQPHTLGVTMSTVHSIDGQQTRTDIDGIAVLRGLPTPLFEGVVAHEIGHVWLLIHNVKGLSQAAEEGFCELLAYRYYAQLNTPEGRFYAERIEKNPDPVYGEGFRRVRAIAERMGFTNLLNTLQTGGRVPGM